MDNKLVVSSVDPDIIDRNPISCDKILIYYAFPSSYTQVIKVSHHHHLLCS